MKTRYIPVSHPIFDKVETEYVLSVLSEGAVSGLSDNYIKRFEEDFTNYCGCSYGVAVSNGTAALHLALASLGVGPKDEVLVSAFTHMATFLAVLYQGAIPVPVDIVDIFRNVDAIPGIVDEAIAIKANVVWMQLGLAHNASAQKAAESGLVAVQSKCFKIEHQKLMG